MSHPLTSPLYHDLIVASGHHDFSEAAVLARSIIERLCSLIPAATRWGKANGYPLVEDYPQYEQVRDVGEDCYEFAGFEGMQIALRSTQRGLEDYPPERYDYAIITFGWSGIGGWQT